MKPLGEWKTRPHQQWSWIVRLTDMVLFHRHSQGWEQFYPAGANVTRVTRSTERVWYFINAPQISDPPTGELAAATPSFNVMDGDLLTITWSGKFPPPERTQLVEMAQTQHEEASEALQASTLYLPQMLPNFIASINASDYFRHLVGPIQQPREEDLVEITSYIRSGTLLVCSDGSFHPHSGMGSHAWVFATSTGHILLQGAGPIDCHPKQLSSYRPELGGITSLLFLLAVIVRTGSVTTGQVKLYCDNQSALDNVFNSTPKRGIDPLLKVDYDLLVLAKDLVNTLPITRSR